MYSKSLGKDWMPDFPGESGVFMLASVVAGEDPGFPLAGNGH